MKDAALLESESEKKYCPKCYQQFDSKLEECPDDGTVLRGPKNDPWIGKVFADRYDVLSVLGLGGMSIVYKAKHRLMDRIVAIKMMHSKMKEDVVALERFKLEAQAASSLNHQNIISVYDFGVTPDGEPYFVMDCLQGESLKDLIERKGMVPYQRALPIFRQICDGLDAAQKKGIVHRDIKPANVVLVKEDDGTEQVKLVDFGIAKLLPGSGKDVQRLTQTGEVFGSPIYMSPEQCLGKELDARSDIYAIGCLMYEALTGVPPIIGESFFETMSKHINEPPKPLSEIAPDAKIPADLEQLVLHCLSKAPGDRYQTAGEIRDQLAAMSLQLLGKTGGQTGFISGVVAPSATSQNKAITKTSMSPVVVIGAVVLFSLLALLIFCATWQGPPEDHGTPLNKLFYSMKLAQCANETKNGQFEQAELTANQAEQLARTFGNDTHLEDVLRLKTEIYTHWEGHAEQLENANTEIADLQVKRVKRELADRYKMLSALEIPAQSPVAKTNLQLQAEAQIPAFLSTASKLHGRSLYDDEEKFLNKAVAVEMNLLGEDSQSVTPLETKLADCLIQLHKFSAVRPFLVHVYEVRKKNITQGCTEYLRALNRLGQFDLDQSEFKKAGVELTEAYDQSKKRKASKDILLLSMRSYADYLRQSGKQKESKKILQEANDVEKH